MTRGSCRTLPSTRRVSTRLACFVALAITISVAQATAQAPAPQPSFDCKKAVDRIGQVICTDLDLAHWDGRMGQVYKQRLARLFERDRRALIETQRQWISSRNTQCNQAELTASKFCILRLTKARIAILEQGDHEPLQLVPPSATRSDSTLGGKPAPTAPPFQSNQTRGVDEPPSGWSEPVRRVKAQLFDPIIAQGMRPNFADKYVVVVGPCGSGCRFYSVGDVTTGRVIGFPLGGEEYGHLNLHFRLDSTLIIAVWDDYGERCLQEGFKWEKGAFVSLGRSSTPRQDHSDCEVLTQNMSDWKSQSPPVPERYPDRPREELARRGDESLPIATNRNPAFHAGVPLKMEGGIFMVPVEINGTMTLDFAIDSGASDVSVPADVFSTLTRTGTIKESDFVGKRTYVMADGTKSQSTTFTIRSLKVGGIVVKDVTCSIVASHGSLLLGQSFFERFKSWSIDNAKHELLLEP